MKVEDIEIHVGETDFAFTPVRRLEAKCEATMAFSPAPTIDDMNAKLREMAAKLGANAVVEVTYNSGVSMTSWKSMKGTGLAVIRESDERSCPECAETIKRAASKCRYCGADLKDDTHALTPAPTPGIEPTGAPAIAQVRAPIPAHEAEPLRETNNPQTWLIVGAVVFVILTILGTMA